MVATPLIRNVLRVWMALVVAGCGAASPSRVPTPPATGTAPAATAAPTAQPTPTAFPIDAFAAITDDPVTPELAARLQAALATHDVTGGGGMSATVMTAEGTWSGTTGKADGVRDLQVDDQFAIASITKSVVAAQVMLMVEAGELALDDPVSDYLPSNFRFDTNGATIRQLLGHRSGLPDYYDLLYESQQSDFQRVWTPAEILGLLPADRTATGTSFSYAETNYLILKLVIEHVRGRPLTDVLRAGALAVDGLDRLVHQPAERPTQPVAMPRGASSPDFAIRGGYLPSLASASAYNASGAIASDSKSLARWWRAFCAGEIVSQASLAEMSKFEPASYLDSYGLGLYNPAHGYAIGYGHTGELPGYMSWAACLPEEGAVIVVLTNHYVDDGQLAYSHGLARPLVDALRAASPPSPTLIARGSVVEHDFDGVEFEATREGAKVTGRMKVGTRREVADWPLVVDLQCARTTEDGLVLIGGVVTEGNTFAPAGTLAGIALQDASPLRATVWVGGVDQVAATFTTDCTAYLDARLTYSHSVWGEAWIPFGTLDPDPTVEFGP